jgi:hypothetical protein
MNTSMADGASERLDAQIADALFGQPGMSKIDVTNRLRQLRGTGAPLLVALHQAEKRRFDSSAEDRFEQFLQAEIARSPNALRELGVYLADVLDEDRFPAANRLLLQLATEYAAPLTQTEEPGQVRDETATSVDHVAPASLERLAHNLELMDLNIDVAAEKEGKEMAEHERDSILQALRVAFRHLDMSSMRVSHCKDAAIIDSALSGSETNGFTDTDRLNFLEWNCVETADELRLEKQLYFGTYGESLRSAIDSAMTEKAAANG